jgi:hypothetical protein
MLERGRADPGVLERVANGTPLAHVEVHRSGGAPFIVVILIN